MGAKQISENEELDKFKLYTMADTERITTYSQKALDAFRRDGRFKTRKLNGGKVVTTKKWIVEFLNAISDEGPLEF